MKRGFTLIELMVAIAIIGVLSTIVIASLSSAKANSRDAKRLTDVKSIQIALSQYYNDNNKYPATLNSGLAPLYISALPKDPSTGQNYFYASLGTVSLGNCNNTTRYHIGAALESSNNSNLNEDNDNSAVPQSIGGTTFYSCSTSNTDFVGQSPDCGDGSVSGADRCYDLINN